MKKHLTLAIATLALVTLTLVTLRLTYAGTPKVEAADEDSALRLTFDESFVGPNLCDPLFTKLAIFHGKVDGDFSGSLTTHLLDAPQFTTESVNAPFDLIVEGGAGGEFSFTARATARFNLRTQRFEMEGVVTKGFRTGKQVRVRGRLADLQTVRLKGKIRVGLGGEEEDEDDR